MLNEMRVFKSENEVVQMRRLGQAAGRAFTESMRQDFTREKDLYSFLEYQFKVNGCDGNAFVPVVAGGQVKFPTFSFAGFDTDRPRMLWLFITPEMTMY
jgi:Xaa-Pro aminopeptidase